MNNENETVEQVCELMDKESGEYHIDDYGLSYNDIWNYRERILSSHKRELAAKDAEIEYLKAKNTEAQNAVDGRNKVIAKLRRKNIDLSGCLLTEQELAEKRNALIKELADALLKSPCGEIYQLGLTDDDGNIYEGCSVKFSSVESKKMPRVGHGDMFSVVPYELVAKAREMVK